MDKKSLKVLLKEFNSLAENVDRIRAFLEENLAEQDSSTNAKEDDQRVSSSIQGTSAVDILDLSADLKVVQLTVLKLGASTLEELAKETDLPKEELRIYLKTLVRQGLLNISEGKYKAVMRKRGAKSFTLLDKLDRG